MKYYLFKPKADVYGKTVETFEKNRQEKHFIVMLMVYRYDLLCKPYMMESHANISDGSTSISRRIQGIICNWQFSITENFPLS
jgi:hypothetical protein